MHVCLPEPTDCQAIGNLPLVTQLFYSHGQRVAWLHCREEAGLGCGFRRSALAAAAAGDKTRQLPNDPPYHHHCGRRQYDVDVSVFACAFACASKFPRPMKRAVFGLKPRLQAW